jgi:hypothetical protein
MDNRKILSTVVALIGLVGCSPQEQLDGMDRNGPTAHVEAPPSSCLVLPFVNEVVLAKRVIFESDGAQKVFEGSFQVNPVCGNTHIAQADFGVFGSALAVKIEFSVAHLQQSTQMLPRILSLKDDTMYQEVLYDTNKVIAQGGSVVSYTVTAVGFAGETVAVDLRRLYYGFPTTENKLPYDSIFVGADLEEPFLAHQEP